MSIWGETAIWTPYAQSEKFPGISVALNSAAYKIGAAERLKPATLLEGAAVLAGIILSLRPSQWFGAIGKCR